MTFEELAFADVRSPEQSQELCAKAMEVMTAFVMGNEAIPRSVAMALGVVTACAGRTIEAEAENQRLEWSLDQAMARPCKACGARER